MSVELVSAASDTRTARRTLRRFSPWALLVVGSLVVLVAGAAVLAALWLGSSRTTTVAYAVPGTLLGIEVRVQSGDVTVVGGSRTGVSVTRSDHSVYGHGPREQRLVRSGVLHLGSSCPVLVLGSCASNFRIEVPDNVPITRARRARHGPPRGLSRLGEYHNQGGLDQRRGLLRVGARRHIDQRQHHCRNLLLAGNDSPFSATAAASA